MSASKSAPPPITPAVEGQRTIAQFFFEVGYAACFADVYIRGGGKVPFSLSDAIVERAWQIAGEAHEDPAEWDAYKARSDAHDELVEALRRLVHDIYDLIGNSDGVYGLHQNGDPSPWGEISEAGQYEPWLGEALTQARAALSKALGHDGGEG